MLSADARRHRLPPRRSLVRPALLAAFGLWLYLGSAAMWSARVEVTVAWALLGAYLVPATLVLESGRRLQPSDGASTATLLRLMLAGSLLAAAMSALPGPGELLWSAPAPVRALSVLAPAAAAAVAVAVLVALMGRRTIRSRRTGLFVGGAIGAGFAAFTALSSVLEAVQAFTGVHLPSGVPAPILLESAVTVQQAILAATTWPVWGALIGAAVFGSRRGLAATLAGVVATHVLLAAASGAAAGLLGSSPAALAVQLMVAAAIAAPGLALWARRVRTLRPDPEDQRGGA